MFPATNFLRFIAMFFITNSHLHDFYPIKQLATGGSLGDALFFMLSGYGLVLSSRNQLPFFSWYKIRIARIYPPVIIASILSILLVDVTTGWNFLNYAEFFIYPTRFWFVGAIMLFYAIIYFCMKQKSPKLYLYLILALVVPYIYFYFTSLDLTQWSIEGNSGNEYFKWIFYLQIMLFGSYIGLKKDQLKPGKVKESLILFALFLLYFGFKFALTKGLMQWQGLLHPITFAIVYYSFLVANSSFIVNKLMKAKWIGSTITFLSGLTLEIYLIQHIVFSNAFILHMRFPYKLIVFWVLTILLAYAVFGVSKLLMNLRSKQIAMKAPQA